MRDAYRIYYHSVVKANIRQELKKVNTSLKKGYMDSLDKTKQGKRDILIRRRIPFLANNVSDVWKEEITRIQGSV